MPDRRRKRGVLARTVSRSTRVSGRTPEPSRIAAGVGLVAGVAALAAGGIAAGIELERRIVGKRIREETSDGSDGSGLGPEDFFGLRADGPLVRTPDGVLLHTEVDDLDGASTPAPGAPARVADGLTVVFVHGYALSLDCWHFQRKHFRGSVRQVFYDQRSHGRSGRSAPELCRIPQLADDLAQVLDEVVGDGPVVLVGHSMGGMTIMHLAQTHPEWFGTRIRGVALFSTSAGEMDDYSPIRGLPGRSFNRLAQPLMATLNRVPDLVEKGRRAGSDIGYVVTRRMSYGSDVPVSYVEFMSEMLGDTPLEVVADYYPAFAELDEARAFEVLGRVETAVIGGADDMITPVHHTQKIIEMLPGAESSILPECGHMGIIEHHAEFNQTLDHLLQRARRHLDD